jgi:AcrR family transcriptional regulator
MTSSKTMTDPGPDAEGLPRLPPGRHGLPREFVVKNQRDRLAAGVIAAVAEYGYHGTTVTGIATAAGVSRRTFYAYFSSRVECFLDTYEAVARHLAEVVAGAGAGGAEWPDRVRAELRALLEALAANPDLVNFCFVAPQSAGGEAAVAYRRLLDRLLVELTAEAPQPAGRPVSESGRQSLVGGISALLVARADAGEDEPLTSLLADLQELVLGPYLGREAAARIARSSV